LFHRHLSGLKGIWASVHIRSNCFSLFKVMLSLYYNRDSVVISCD